MDMLRYKGQWYVVKPKAYEPERQTFQVAWKMIREGKNSEDAYREFWKKEREDVKVLYPSFRKDDHRNPH